MSTETKHFITKEVKLIKCTHCGHIWQPRLNRLPKVCPHCRSRKYLEPRQRKAHTKTRSMK